MLGGDRRGAVNVGALAVVFLLLASACSSDTTTDAAAGSQPTATSPDASGADDGDRSSEPLWTSDAGLEVSVDDERLSWLAMAWESWDGMAADPVENFPSAAVVVAQGTTLELSAVEVADLKVTLYNLTDESTFDVLGEPATATGLSVDVVVDDLGLMFLKVEAAFGESANYAGSGRLRYHGLVHVAPAGSPCVAAGPVKVDVLSFSGLFDTNGCPAPAGEERLNWESLLPEFHCAPWPPSLVLPDHPSASSTFLKFDFPESELVRTRQNTLPEDAVELGFELPAGPVFTSESVPDSVFIDRGDGTVEQWLAEVEGFGCA